MEPGQATYPSTSERPSESPRARAPVREPEIAELRAFCAAAALGSIAEAARAMNVSQPAMSKRLKSLETVVGTELFERSSRGVTLTATGVQLYAAARRLLLSADTVHALISNERPLLPVRLAVSPTAAELWLPQVLTELAKTEERLAAEVVTANSAVVRELVMEGRCELGIVGLDPFVPATDGLEERPLWRDEVIVFVPDGHRWQDLLEIPVVDFAETPLVEWDPMSNTSRVVTSTLEHSGVHRAPPVVAIGSSASVIAVAIALRTPALISRDAVRGYGERGHVIRRVEGIRFKREFALVWTGHMLDLAPAVQAVARHALELPFLQAADALT